MLNPNLTKIEAEWLLNEYQPKMNGRVDGTTMDTYFLPARKLITGNDVRKPSCGCEFKVFAQITTSMFEQYKPEIETVANQVVKVSTRGRKKQS